MSLRYIIRHVGSNRYDVISIVTNDMGKVFRNWVADAPSEESAKDIISKISERT